jgi:predicted metallo-beta-lactamase superfamily hydrolase
MGARATPMTENQRMALSVALDHHLQERSHEQALARSVKHALGLGVPILTLANALGVSRSRIRRLAR